MIAFFRRSDKTELKITFFFVSGRNDDAIGFQTDALFFFEKKNNFRMVVNALQKFKIAYVIDRKLDAGFTLVTLLLKVVTSYYLFLIRSDIGLNY